MLEDSQSVSGDGRKLHVSKWVRVQALGFWWGMIIAAFGYISFLWLDEYAAQARDVLSRGAPGLSLAERTQLAAASGDMLNAMMMIALLVPVAVALTLFLSLAGAFMSNPWPRRKAYAVAACIALAASLLTLNVVLQSALKGPY